MKLFTTTEVALSLVLLVIVLALANPFGFWMPMMAHVVVLSLLAVIVGLFAGLVVYNHVPDERERDHESRAGRFGYTAGLVALSVAIVTEVFLGKALDLWLPGILLVIVVANIAARAYGRLRH